jgi:hypothetical protein
MLADDERWARHDVFFLLGVATCATIAKKDVSDHLAILPGMLT